MYNEKKKMLSIGLTEPFKSIVNLYRYNIQKTVPRDFKSLVSAYSTTAACFTYKGLQTLLVLPF